MAKRNLVGLDIGSTMLRAAEVQMSNGDHATSKVSLQRYAETSLPPGAVKDGEIFEAEPVIKALRGLWQSGKFSSKDVALGVGSQRVIVRNFEMPGMPMSQLQASLPFQARDQLPVSIDDVLLDYYPIATREGSSGPLLDGLLVAGNKDMISTACHVVEKAGLQPQTVDLNAFALARGILRGRPTDGLIVLVDIGADITTVTVMLDKFPQFVRVLPAGGQDITEGLVARLGVSSAEAEGIKRAHGLDYHAPPEMQEAVSIIGELSRSQVEAIRNTIMFYTSNQPQYSVDWLVLSGGGAHLPGLGQYISTAVQYPVVMAEPLSGIEMARRFGKDNQLQNNQSLMGLALGLSMGDA